MTVPAASGAGGGPAVRLGRSDGLDSLLRLGLLLVVAYLGYLGLRSFLLLAQAPLDGDMGVAAPRATAQTGSGEAQRRAARAALPAPVYPGARRVEFGQMRINDRQFVRGDYEVRTAPEDVLAFYRRWFAGRGWRDTTEESFGLAVRPGRGAEGVINLQNERFLRHYDQVMSTSAAFARRNGQVVVSVRPGNRQGWSRVGVQYSEFGSPEELARVLGGVVPGRSGVGSGRPVEFTQPVGGGTARTAMRASRLPPAAFFNQLRSEHRRDGWQAVDMPDGAPPAGPLQAVFRRGRETAFLHVTPADKGRGSRALTSVMPGP